MAGGKLGKRFVGSMIPAPALTSSPELSPESSPSINAMEAWLAPFSAGTRRKYQEAFRSLGAFLGSAPSEVPALLLEYGRGPVRTMLELWLRSGHELTAAYRIMQLSAVQSWLRWAEESDLGGPGRVRVRHGLTQEAPQVELVTELRVKHELQELLSKPDEKRVRDAVVISMLAVLGIRRSTLARVSVGDFSRDFSRLRVRRKGGKVDLVEVPEDLSELLRSWLAISDIREGRILARLDCFGQVVKQGLSPERIYQICVARVGCSPHALRRLGGAHAMASGADMEALRGFLGHRGLGSTARYTRREGDSGGVVRRSLSRALLPRKSDAQGDPDDS